jgi:hypothetical protein
MPEIVFLSKAVVKPKVSSLGVLDKTLVPARCPPRIVDEIRFFTSNRMDEVKQHTAPNGLTARGGAT